MKLKRFVTTLYVTSPEEGEKSVQQVWFGQDIDEAKEVAETKYEEWFSQFDWLKDCTYRIGEFTLEEKENGNG